MADWVRSVNAQFDRLLDYVSERVPAVAEHLEAAREDHLASTAFPSTSGPKSGPTTPPND